jgi:hypothetical protein
MAAVLAVSLPHRSPLLCGVLLIVSGFALVRRVLVVLALVMFLSGGFGLCFGVEDCMPVRGQSSAPIDTLRAVEHLNGPIEASDKQGRDHEPSEAKSG